MAPLGFLIWFRMKGQGQGFSLARGLGLRFSTFPVRGMSTNVEVSLLSGKTATVQAGLDETVETLSQRAQMALGVGKGRFLDSCGVVLDGCLDTKTSRIQNGDTLTLHVNGVQIQSTDFAFAAILGDGSVVTWGDARHGGDSGAVQGQRRRVIPRNAARLARARARHYRARSCSSLQQIFGL